MAIGVLPEQDRQSRKCITMNNSGLSHVRIASQRAFSSHETVRNYILRNTVRYSSEINFGPTHETEKIVR